MAASEFATKINRQRVAPTLVDFSYLTLRSNLKTMEEFAALGPAGARVLDAGCGFKPWLKFFPDATYIGVDYSPKSSTPEALSSVDFLPFPDNTFDAIICSEVIEHTRYPESCISELRRVCRDGGHIYISAPFCFPEHGIPYDFQRPTQYFYREVFKSDKIVALKPTSSTLGSAFTAFNFFVECTPLRLLWGVRHVIYIFSNLMGLLCDAFIKSVAFRIMPSLKLYTHALPLGYNMIIRVKKAEK